MLVLIDNEPVVVQTRKEEDREDFIKSKEFKEIAKALDTLTKYCEDFVFSAYTKKDEDKASIVYNHAKGDYNSRLYKNRTADHGEKDAKQCERGARLSVHLANLLFEAEDEYGVNKESVIKTIKVGAPATEQLMSLTKRKQEEFMERAQQAKSYEEVREIMEEYMPGIVKALDNEGATEEAIKYATDRTFGEKKSLNGMVRGDMNKVDVKKLERTIKLATGAEVKGIRMDSVECLEPIATSLCENLGAAAVMLGIVRLDEDNKLQDGDSTWLVYDKKLVEKMKPKSEKDDAINRVALASEMILRVISTLSEKFNIEKDMWIDMIEDNFR